MNGTGYTLVRIPGSDAIYRLPAGCPVTDENLRRFGERVSPPSGDVVNDPTDLVAWLNACYDRAGQAARAALGDADADPWTDPYGEFQGRGGPVFDHVVAHGPKWRLADIARKRKILAEHQPVKATSERRWSSGLACVICDQGRWPDYPCTTVRLLAAEFADEPGYDAQRWAP